MGDLSAGVPNDRSGHRWLHVAAQFKMLEEERAKRGWWLVLRSLSGDSETLWEGDRNEVQCSVEYLPWASVACGSSP